MERPLVSFIPWFHTISLLFLRKQEPADQPLTVCEFQRPSAAQDLMEPWQWRPPPQRHADREHPCAAQFNPETTNTHCLQLVSRLTLKKARWAQWGYIIATSGNSGVRRGCYLGGHSYQLEARVTSKCLNRQTFRNWCEARGASQDTMDLMYRRNGSVSRSKGKE